VPLRARVHPLVSFPSSSEFVAAFYLPVLRGCPRPPSACSRVPLPFATRVREVHLPASFPPWPMFRPQRFARSRRLPPSRTLQACFILLPRPGFALQGFSPLPSHSPRRRAVPSCRSAEVSSQRVAPLVPVSPAPPSGLCSEQRSVVADQRLNLPTTRSPPALSTPAGFSSNTLVTPSRPLRS
jgi:hypothetical protein